MCVWMEKAKKVVSTSILDLGEVIESDHAEIRVDIEWKGVMGQRKKMKKAQKKKVSEQTEMGSVWKTDEWEGF